MIFSSQWNKGIKHVLIMLYIEDDNTDHSVSVLLLMNSSATWYKEQYQWKNCDDADAEAQLNLENLFSSLSFDG